MARLVLRDLSTNEDFEVPIEGYLFGRVGGDADVQLEDNSISRRQARVSMKNGAWLYEVLYVPKGAPPAKPETLKVGAVFAVGVAEFEVVELEGGPKPKAAAPPAKKAPPAGDKTAGVPPVSKSKAGAGEAPANDIKALFAGVPKGVAYYLVNVPKLLVNPIGTVRKTIEELPAEPLGRNALIGYALPALLATGLLGSWAAGLALLIGPTHTFSVMAFIPIGPAIGAVIGAVITGFIFHPLLTWIIKFLKGESDERSRSNYFLQTMTVSIVLAVPGALGAILGALPVPFLPLLGPLLGIVASLASLYVTLKWFEFFKTVKWFKYVLLVLGALTVLSGVLGLVSGITAQIAGLSASSGSGGGEVEVEVKGDDDGDSKAVQADVEDDSADGQDKPPPEKVAVPDRQPPPEKVVAAPPPEKEKEEDNTPPPPETPVATGGGDYAAFARRRDAVEKAFADNPTLLQRSKELQKLYGDYLDAVQDIDKRYAADLKKSPQRAKLYQHLKEAELSQKAGKTVDSMAGKLKLK